MNKKQEKKPIRKRTPNKLRIAVTMNHKGNISGVYTKGPNSLVTKEDIDIFLKHTREELDELEARWKSMYKD